MGLSRKLRRSLFYVMLKSPLLSSPVLARSMSIGALPLRWCRCWRNTIGRLWDAKHENLSNEIDRIKKQNDNMRIELRHLNGEDINSLAYKDLLGIDDTLERGLSSFRSKKQQHEMAAAMNGETKDMENGYQQRVSDCQSHMPFSLRLRPTQPNLQERFYNEISTLNLNSQAWFIQRSSSSLSAVDEI